MMWDAVGQALPSAAGIAISPVPLVLLIVMLVSARGKVNAVAFAIAWTVTTAVVMVVVYLLSDGADVSSGGSSTGQVIHLILGASFFVIAVKEWRRRPAPGEEPPESKVFAAADTMGPLGAMGIAAMFAAVNLKNLPLAISVGVTITRAGLTGTEGVVAAVIVAVLASLSVLVPVLVVLVLGDRTRPALDSLTTWLLHNNATIMFVLFVVLGAKMLGSGLGILD